MKDLSQLAKIEYTIRRLEANQPELSGRINQIHVNEILSLVRDDISLNGRNMSIDRLEILDDILQVFAHDLRRA